jgi:two-component system chemotaxis response regulator CheB
LIERLVHEPVEAHAAIPHDLQVEVQIVETGRSDADLTEKLGELTTLSCPECGGPLWEQALGCTARYRCRVGHAYSAASLLSAENEAIEAAIWAAVRLFEQRANVLTSMAARDREAERPRMLQHHQTLAQEARTQAELLRRIVVDAGTERREETVDRTLEADSRHA